MPNKTVAEVVSELRSLASANLERGNGTAASVYHDAASHVERELGEESGSPDCGLSDLRHETEE